MNTKVRQNSADQMKAAELREELKVNELKAKVIRAFSAPEFDKNSFAAEMIKAGKDFMEILAAVNEGKKAWDEKHLAPAYSTTLLKNWIKANINDDFSTVCGCNIDDVDGKTYSNTGAILETCETLAGNVSAIFSYRFKVQADNKAAKIQSERKSIYREGSFNLVRGAKLAGYDLERVIRDIRDAWGWVEGSDSKTALRIKSNIQNITGRLNETEIPLLTVGLETAKGKKLLALRKRYYSDISALLSLLAANGIEE